MKKINFAIGLPRSGSTLSMNILQQNPMFYTSSTCPIPTFIEACTLSAVTTSEFVAMDQDRSNQALLSFTKYGIEGWYSSLTDKPMVFSKNREWLLHLNLIFALYQDPKILVNIRDLRDIICSYEKLMLKYPVWTLGKKADDALHLKSLWSRIQIYCTDTSSNLGRSLFYIHNLIEWMYLKPNNFFVVKYEDFVESPINYLKNIYNWLELPYFDHDLNNIPQSEEYEHDSAYRSLVSHKTMSQINQTKSTWSSMLSQEQSQAIIDNNRDFYQNFYPEVLSNLQR